MCGDRDKYMCKSVGVLYNPGVIHIYRCTNVTIFMSGRYCEQVGDI